MDLILAKKYTELEELIDRVIQDAMFLSSADKHGKIEFILDKKLMELKKWMEERTQPRKGILSEPKREIVKPEPFLGKPNSLPKSFPSFMAPTLSSIANATVSPRYPSTERTRSNGRSRSNGKSRMASDEEYTPSFMTPKPPMSSSMMNHRSGGSSRSGSTSRSRGTSIEETNPSEKLDEVESESCITKTVNFSSKLTTTKIVDAS